MIRNAKFRVQLASLYIGPAANATNTPKEREFLNAIKDASSRPGVDVKILLDANRSLRPIKKGSSRTSSAEAVNGCLNQKGGNSALYLFQALQGSMKSLLPSPLNEVAGVFHVKAYIVDDSLILSGANLSEEYFEDRQDRYMLFENGAGGLVDFYSNLIDTLCEHGHKYRDGLKNRETNKSSQEVLLDSLSNLMDGSDNSEVLQDESSDIVSYAVPTFQAPRGFFQSALPFFSDVEVTRNLLLTALELDPASTVRLSSAYLNPTPNFMYVLSKFGTTPSCSSGTFGAAHLMTAGGTSHGFAPKKKKIAGHGNGRDFIPSVFDELSREAAQHIIPNGGKVLLYERRGWTFHSKGLWLNFGSENQDVVNNKRAYIMDPQNVTAHILGSGNYGSRSEFLDVESNLILVMPDRNTKNSTPLKNSLANEWNDMCDFTEEWDCEQKQEVKLRHVPLRKALPFIRTFF